MKKLLLGILICGFVLSCKSTGTVSAPESVQGPAPVPSPAPTPVPTPAPGSTPTFSPNPKQMEEKPLEQIYEQHEPSIILRRAKEHTVIKGDTLSSIARMYYGTGDNGYYFPLIIAASKLSVNIVDPDEIEVGMKFIIPDLQENLNDPEARRNLKNLLKEVAAFYSHKPGPQSTRLHDGLTRLYNTL
ncbi:MAG: LysM peptidoglycan-binding domain-containing protein [Treponema sp.]|jgi:uncharacterized protein (UPF0216 family)|nr:LysM peptidoglycan-binding domain-containing protein [Treponema sp.]